MNKLDKLSQREGIIAAACTPYNDFSKTEFRGDEKWRDTVFASFHLLEASPESFIRVSVGECTIFLEGEEVYLYAAVIPTGHPIAKSLRRTLRRYATPKPRKKNVEGRVERAPEIQKTA
jgi:hypothetical protein